MKQKQPSLTFEEIEKTDIPALTAVMVRAFDDDAQKYLNQERGGPPGYDNGEFFLKWVFEEQNSIGYKIIVDDCIVGSFIIWVCESGDHILGNIFVDPSFQDKGIGTRTWEFIETSYPNSKSWTLETPVWALKNHYFYQQKCGFRKIAIKDDSFIYRKEIPVG